MMWGWLARRLLHPSLRTQQDPDLVRRAHILLALSLVTAVTAMSLSVVYLSTGAVLLGTILAVVAPLMVLVVRLPRTARGYRIATHVYLLTWLLVTCVGILRRGGIESHAAVALAFVPLVAVVLQGSRAAVPWLVVVVALLLGLWAADSAGLVGPDVAGTWAQTVDGFAALVIVLIVFGIAAAQDRLGAHFRLRAAEHARAEAEAKEALEKAETERRLLRADRLAAVGQLAAGVAHEVNNPLSYIIGNLEYVLQRIPEGRVERRPLEEALSGARRVREIVRDLRLYSREVDEEAGAVDLKAALETALRMTDAELRPRARVMRALTDVPKVRASEGRVVQILVNLLINAAQAMEAGDPEKNRLVVSLARQDEGFVRVTVSDTGSGIPEEIMDRIFDPFFTTKPPGVGTGLGLSVCRSLAESYGGRLILESRRGEGTQAHLDLPVATEAQGEAAPAVREEAAGTRCRDATRVAVIDDDPLVRSTLARLLGEHDVVLFASASAALDAIDGGLRPDAIVCDLIMPGMTGMTFYRHLESSHPDLAGRVVFATGGATDPKLEAFLEASGRPVLRKPFDRACLEAAVAAAAAPSSKDTQRDSATA